MLMRDPLLSDDFRAATAPTNASPSRGKLRPGKELIILSDETNQDSGHQDTSLSSSASTEQATTTTTANGKKIRPNSSAKGRSGAEGANNAAHAQAVVGAGGDGDKSFAGLSMMERQAEWLKKKQDKMEAERLRQEEEKEKELTFQPKIIRRVTYTAGDKPGKETTAAAVPQRQLQRGESYNNSRKAADATVAAGPREKSIPKPPRAGGKVKRRKSQSVIPQSVTQTIEIGSDLLDSMKSELEASQASRRPSKGGLNEANGEEMEIDGDNDDDEDGGGEQDDLVSTEKESTEAGGAASLVDTAQAQPTKSWSDRPTINGRRVDFDSGDTKARLVLQDASRFDLTSMYRKTDKKAGRDGVALLMGRREDTFEEEVIAVLFDKEKVSELDAARWWLDHEHRFSEFMRTPMSPSS